MTKLAVIGLTSGRRTRVDWRDGTLDGDPFTVAAVEDLVTAGVTVEAGNITAPASVSVDEDLGVVIATLARAFDVVERVEAPEPPEPEAGATP